MVQHNYKVKEKIMYNFLLRVGRGHKRSQNRKKGPSDLLLVPHREGGPYIEDLLVRKFFFGLDPTLHVAYMKDLGAKTQ